MMFGFECHNSLCHCLFGRGQYIRKREVSIYPVKVWDSLFFYYRACLQNTLNSWCSLGIWVSSPACILWWLCCCLSITSQKSDQMPTKFANSFANPSPLLWLTWVCGRSAKNTMHDWTVQQLVFHTHSIMKQMSGFFLVFQIAFEVLSFVSVMSNCWLLMSPRLQELLQEGGMSSTNIVLLAVLVEVRGRKTDQ